MSTATDMLDRYLAAEQDILKHGQTNRIGEQQMTTSNLPEIQAGRREWESRVLDEQKAASGVYSPHSLVRLRQ